MLDVLSPIMKALVADELLRYPNEDVKIAVASCISEITRITAPEAPYEDEQMKEVFQLIVSSFENLSDTSSDSYSKRTLILETVAKVLYADGDLEVLNLRDEKWKIVRSDDSMEDGEEETRPGGSDSHPEMCSQKSGVINQS